MILSATRQLWVLAAIFGLTIGSATLQTRAADDVANPQYAAWAKFKPGSSATLSCDMKVGPNAIDIHIEMTKTLVEVAADSLIVESSTKSKAMGHESNTPATKQTVKATAPAKDVKETGTADVMAAGKTYTCKVLELTGDAAAANASRPGGRPAAANAKATIYVNHDVPGGVVKMELTAGDGKVMTFILTASEVK